MDFSFLVSFRNQAPSIIRELQQFQQGLLSLDVSPVPIGDSWDTRQGRKLDLLRTLSWTEPAFQLIRQVATVASELERACQSKMDSVRAALVPWTNMPFEITSFIFELVMLDTEDEQLARQALWLSSISRNHRHVALNTCALWSRVWVRDSTLISRPHFLPSLNIIHTFARRSRASPTILSIRESCSYPKMAFGYRDLLAQLDEPPAVSWYTDTHEAFELIWTEDLRMLEALDIQGNIATHLQNLQFLNITQLRLHLTHNHIIEDKDLYELLCGLPNLDTFTLETDGNTSPLENALKTMHHGLGFHPDFLSNLRTLVIILDVDYNEDDDARQLAWSASIKDSFRLVVDAFNTQRSHPESTTPRLQLYTHQGLVFADELPWYTCRVESLRLYSDEWSGDWTEFMEKDDIDPVTLPALLARPESNSNQHPFNLAEEEEEEEEEEDGDSDDESVDSDEDDSVSTTELQYLYDAIQDEGFYRMTYPDYLQTLDNLIQTRQGN